MFQTSRGQGDHEGDSLGLPGFGKGIVNTVGKILPPLSPVGKLSQFSVGLDVTLYMGWLNKATGLTLVYLSGAKIGVCAYSVL